MVARLLGYRVVHEAMVGDGVARVIENRTDRRLRFGGAWDDQSALDLSDPVALLLPYTRAAAFGLALPARLGTVLHVGLGGGTLARFVHHHYPAVHQDAVELYPEVVDIARRWFALPPAVNVLVGDAAALMGTLDGPYDLVYLDAFTPSGRIVPHLQVAEFLSLLHTRIGPRGWLVANVPGLEDARAMATRLRPFFTIVGRLAVNAFDQHLVLASDASGLAGRLGLPRRAITRGARVGLDLLDPVDDVVWG
jgi:spermidine synthase